MRAARLSQAGADGEKMRISIGETASNPGSESLGRGAVFQSAVSQVGTLGGLPPAAGRRIQRSADFPVCCIADFPVGGASEFPKGVAIFNAPQVGKPAIQ